jgi:LDH2 family malate/lactate/ureidoglycolate dehydrogenase
MLERFRVPPAEAVRVPYEALCQTVTEIFVACGVPSQEAAAGADVLATADLRGVESHGVSNSLRYYVSAFRAGDLNPRPCWTIDRETAGTATIDGDRGLGVLQGTAAMQLAIDKARRAGVGVVTMRNSGHLGAVGHFAMQAADQDMVGVCLTSTSPQVLPTFGAVPRFGTNPISFAAPAKREPVLFYDAATSTIATNKIGLARRVGAPLAPGWIADPAGTPVMAEGPVPEGEGVRMSGHQLLPLGSTREMGSHKGYGLALMVEVMTTMLAGSIPTMIDDVRPMAHHYFAAYDVAAFTDLDAFKETMDQMLQTLAATPPAPGHDRVIYPGLIEHETAIERRANGIPLHREVVAWFDSCTEELGLVRLERL